MTIQLHKRNGNARRAFKNIRLHSTSSLVTLKFEMRPKIKPPHTNNNNGNKRHFFSVSPENKAINIFYVHTIIRDVFADVYYVLIYIYNNNYHCYDYNTIRMVTIHI